jgi:Helix-turn-helix domain
MSSADRIEVTAQMLAAAAQDQAMFVSGDQRVSESDAAALLGYSGSTLRQLRGEGKGPTAYSIGMNGSRWSYRLYDLAAWVEGRRDFPDE